MIELAPLFASHWSILVGCGVNCGYSIQRGGCVLSFKSAFIHFFVCILSGIAGFWFANAYIEINGLNNDMPNLILFSQAIFAAMGPNGFTWVADRALLALSKRK